MYTTALPPAVCAASIAGIKLIQENPSMRVSLWHNVRFIKDKLRLLNINTISSESQIIPILIGDTKKAVNISKLLYESGILIPAIRPPTVPVNTSRLRMTVMSSHTQSDLERLIQILSDVLD